MGLKRSFILIFVVLVVLGGVSSLIFPTEEDVNVQTESTSTGSETSALGTLTVQEVWWTKNGDEINEVEQGDSVEANIKLRANDGAVDGEITVIIRKDIPLFTDTEELSEEIEVKIPKDNNFEVSVSFVASEASSSSFRGYFIEIEGVISWTMDSQFPPPDYM